MIFGFFIASTARLIVAMGVLNSWVILLMKSDLISEIFFCLINWYITEINAIIITSVKTTDSNAILIIEPNKKVFFLGKLKCKEKLLLPNPSSKRGAL